MLVFATLGQDEQVNEQQSFLIDSLLQGLSDLVCFSLIGKKTSRKKQSRHILEE